MIKSLLILILLIPIYCNTPPKLKNKALSINNLSKLTLFIKSINRFFLTLHSYSLAFSQIIQ